MTMQNVMPNDKRNLVWVSQWVNLSAVVYLFDSTIFTNKWHFFAGRFDRQGLKVTCILISSKALSIYHL